MTSEKKCPVVVMGGGPAGVFTACGLADLGIPATLITRQRPYPAWEGLSERPRASLAHFGFERTVAAIGPLVRRKAHWNGISRAQNQEYILERNLFDQALLEDAGNKGVQVIAGRIETVTHRDGHWQLSCRTAQGKHNLTTDFLVEARGREARFGRKQSGIEAKTVTGPATSALLKSYRLSATLPAMTSVASFPKGWAWYLRDGKGTAILQIFVDSDKGGLPRRGGLEEYFARLVHELPEARAWLEGATAENNRVSVRTAAATMTLPGGGKNFLVVGDGSLALDPLSGNGIFYAIGSGLGAAPVINTLMHQPENTPLALQFHRERIEHAFRGGCQSGREFYASEQRWPEQPFWRVRRNWPPASSSPSLPDKGEFCKKPVVKDGFITLVDVIITPDHPRGVWQLDGVPLARLVQLFRGGIDDDNAAVVLDATRAQVTSARGWLTDRNIIN